MVKWATKVPSSTNPSPKRYQRNAVKDTKKLWGIQVLSELGICEHNWGAQGWGWWSIWLLEKRRSERIATSSHIQLYLLWFSLVCWLGLFLGASNHMLQLLLHYNIPIKFSGCHEVNKILCQLTDSPNTPKHESFADFIRKVVQHQINARKNDEDQVDFSLTLWNIFLCQAQDFSGSI